MRRSAIKPSISYELSMHGLIDDDEPRVLWPEQDSDEGLLIRRWILDVTWFTRTRSTGPAPGSAAWREWRLPPAPPPPPKQAGHTRRCFKYQGEVTFNRCYVEAWMKHGIFPPPLHGNPYSPASVLVALWLRDAADPDGPSLGVDDDRGVELQRRRCEAMLAGVREKYKDDDPIIACRCRK